MALRAEQINESTRWQDLTEGLQIYEPGTAKLFNKCKQCLLCVPYCPESSIVVKDGKRQDFDLDHCKGCGICVKACPFNAITMKEGK